MKKIFGILLLVLLLAATLAGCGLTAPRPEIEKGEFPFSVTYEFAGEIKTVSGVYVCEYNGTRVSLDGGAHRDWKSYFKGGELEEMMEIGKDAYGDYLMDEITRRNINADFMFRSDVPTSFTDVMSADRKSVV